MWVKHCISNPCLDNSGKIWPPLVGCACVLSLIPIQHMFGFAIVLGSYPDLGAEQSLSYLVVWCERYRSCLSLKDDILVPVHFWTWIIWIGLIIIPENARRGWMSFNFATKVCPTFPVRVTAILGVTDNLWYYE